MKAMTGATVAALAFGLGLATTPVFAADYAQYRDRDRGQDATQQQDQDNQGDENRDRRGNRDNAKSNRTNTDYNNDNNRGRDDNDRWRNNPSNRTNTDYNDTPRGRQDNDWNNRENRDRDRSYARNRTNDRPYDRDRRFDRDRRDRSNININIYRRNITSPRRYRYHTSYRFPSGYYYRRFHYGQRLPVIFWRDRDYWLLDYIAFGLFAPPPGYVWVRYGPDALLIDTYTGEIIQVRYDVFYS